MTISYGLCWNFDSRKIIWPPRARFGSENESLKGLIVSFMVHCDPKKGSQNQHFQITLLVGREVGHTKEYSVYPSDNVDNSRRPNLTVWCLSPSRTVLLNHCECQEEGTRNVVAECLGKLTLVNADELLPKLKKYLSSDSALIRSTVVTAIKFTISDQVGGSSSSLATDFFRG